jgi:hypothetical protein
MDSDSAAVVEEILSLHQREVGTDPVPSLNNVALRRTATLLMSMALPETKHLDVLLIESTYKHIDDDLHHLYGTLSSSVSEEDEEIQFAVNELWLDANAALSRVLTLAREI